MPHISHSTATSPTPTTIRPVRVCQVVHSLNVGGAELLAARFAHRLGGPAQVVFACLDEDGLLGNSLRQAGYTVRSLGRQPGLDRQCVRRLAEFLRTEGVELIHAHQYTPFFYATLARGWKRQPPILFTEHGRFFPDPVNRKRMLLNPLLFGRTDRIVAVGECVRRALVVKDGLPARRVEVVYNGIPIEAYPSDTTLRSEMRQLLGLTDDMLAVLLVARLDPIKDHATSLAAWERLRGLLPAARLLIVGDGPERERIEGDIARRHLSSSVQMLGTRRDVPRLLAAADVFLLNSLSEGIPLTLLEAMAAGLPAVCTRVGGMPEVVEDGRTGLLVSPQNPTELAAAIERLASQPAERLRMGAAAREAVSLRFNEDLMMARYREIYAAMVCRPVPVAMCVAGGR